MRASGLRAVAIATVLGVAVGLLRFGVRLVVSVTVDVDADRLELLFTSIDFSALTIGLLWIWGTIRAARGDDGAGGGLFALAATVACAALATDALMILDPLVDPEVNLGEDAATTLTSAGRVLWVSAQIGVVIALARLSWQSRRGLALFGAFVALVVAVPMLVLDPAAVALDRSRTSLAVAWWLGIVPPLFLGAGIGIAAWGQPVPAANVWRTFGRSLELIRAALAGVVLVAAAFLIALVLAGADTVWLRVVLTGPLALLGIAAAAGSYRTSRRSIRWARWSFASAAVTIVVLVATQVLTGALVPLGIATIPARELAWIEHGGLGLAAVALASIVFGSARVDRALRRPALTAGTLLTVAVVAGVAAITFRHQPELQVVAREVIVGALLLLGINAMVMTMYLLGRGVRIAEARAHGERVRAAQQAAKQAQLVHERWREARRRSVAR